MSTLIRNRRRLPAYKASGYAYAEATGTQALRG